MERFPNGGINSNTKQQATAELFIPFCVIQSVDYQNRDYRFFHDTTLKPDTVPLPRFFRFSS